MTDHPIRAGLTIGALAKRTGLNVPTIRYYEAIGLIPAANRRPSGHRYYDDQAERLLNFVRQCRDFGFPIDRVRELMALAKTNEKDCVEARSIAQAHLDVVRTKLAEPHVLEQSLSRFVQSCTETCAGGPAAECTILEDLRNGTAPPRTNQSGCCN